MYNQYLVNEPFLSMTAAHLRLQERISSWQSSILISDHSSWSFTHKSSVLVGFLSITFTPKVFQIFFYKRQRWLLWQAPAERKETPFVIPWQHRLRFRFRGFQPLSHGGNLAPPLVRVSTRTVAPIPRFLSYWTG